MQRLITIRVAELVFEDMIGIEDGPLPPESYVLCACDLLELCGHFLDNSGADLMRFWILEKLCCFFGKEHRFKMFMFWFLTQMRKQHPKHYPP